MKKLKIIIFNIVMLSFSLMQGQTITFNGCHALFEDQDYVFNYAGTDGTGRNFYTTTPVNGDQPCGGIGTCEFMIKWNTTNSSWEFIADTGNGDFVNTYLIYSNTSTSTPNPPSLTLGTWTENTSITASECGGNLSSSNATLTGAVQNSTLGISTINNKNPFMVYPNPVKEVLFFESENTTIERVSIMNTQGQRVINKTGDSKQLNVSSLDKGVYFLNLKSKEGNSVYKFTKE
ncbi:T9SS type A sorting domain-containing protein [Flavobacterium faecale]|uniref:T9SS type A sorting domain-containing protein n=1 Tax=Flavobacterium faecale TaxID=1355330 RepID=UPI003AB0FD18